MCVFLKSVVSPVPIPLNLCPAYILVLCVVAFVLVRIMYVQGLTLQQVSLRLKTWKQFVQA